VPESHGNFVFAIIRARAKHFEALREARILVRYFGTPLLRDGMRISIGTPEQMDRLIGTLATVLKPMAISRKPAAVPRKRKTS